MPRAKDSRGFRLAPVRQLPKRGLRSSILLALLLGFAMLFSNIVHAAEQICAPLPASEASAEINGEQMSDGHAQGDSGSLHQHGGCHGHHLASPSSGTETDVPLATASLRITSRNAHLAQAPPESLLRPPTA